MRRALSVAALTLWASALSAQATPPVPDSVRAPAARVGLVVRDSIKPPFPVADRGTVPTHGRTWHWRDDALFQFGAITLAELLELIPGVRVQRSGFLLSPQTLSWLGDPARVRVFLDGVELDALDPRAGSVIDFGAIPIWHLEDVLAEATPGELRVHLRTWRVARTSAATRVDVLAGDAETNLYRGFFGKRFQSGLGLQFGFQQMSLVQNDRGGDGDGLSMFVRAGVARDRWSLDLVSQRVRTTRNATLREDAPGAVPPFTGGASAHYARLALGSPERNGTWAQLIASAHSFEESTPGVNLSAAFGQVPSDTVDSAAFRPQYVAAAGVRRGALQASAGARYRRSVGESLLSPYLRAAWESGRVAANLHVERAQHDSSMRSDAAIRVQALGRLALTAAASHRSPLSHHPDPAATVLRGEAEVSLFGTQLSAGVVTRDSARVRSLPVFARGLGDTVTSAATGFTYGAHVPLFGAVFADLRGTRWESMDFYRPLDDLRLRVGLDTEWRSRFPRGDFTIRLFGTMQNYSRWLAPVEGGAVRMPGVRVYSTLLEVRIKTATISWEFRNAGGARYETVPGYEMPRILNLYGVRWRFTN